VFSKLEKPSPPAPLPQGEGSFFSIIKSKIIKQFPLAPWEQGVRG
jgi:hypothetical protein